jgi:1,4-dihydroxy-2-naphthoate octaprenyltransferase
MTTQTLGKKKLWLAAIKPPMYSVAIVPITVGTAVAFAETQSFAPLIYWTFLGSGIAIIAWLNLTNDVFDADTGIDRHKLHSVVNLTGNKLLVFWIANLFLALGILGILAISWWQKDGTVVAIVLSCCALGYSYQGPPFRLGYQGLGEIICFITFGPMAIAAAYYSQTQTFSTGAGVVAIAIGITTSIILFCSHFHQVEDDLAAGKKSPIVRLGTDRGAKVLSWSIWGLFIFMAIAIAGHYLPIWTLLVFLSLPFAYQLVTRVNLYHDVPESVSNSKFIAVNLHFTSGMLLALGFVLSGII